MLFENLIEETQDKLASMQPTIQRLHEVGIRKELRMRNSSNTVVTYPAKQELNVSERSIVYSADLSGRNALYIHIPFCTGICSYCDFARTASHAEDEGISIYLELLSREVSLWRRLFGKVIPVESIYLGGGTPTLLNLDALEQVFDIIQENFVLVEGGEFTLEGSPETTSGAKIALSKHRGVNRISLGVESFDDRILQAMRRRETVATVFTALNDIREAGIEHIDIDLIRGYPGYTIQMVLNDLEGVRKAGITSVTSYQYSLKPKTIDRKRLPELIYDQEEQLLFHLLFIGGMARLGYLHQEPLVDWFIRHPRWLYQHQIQKWKHMINLLGVGLGSYGYLNGVQYINYESRRDYEAYLREDRLPIEKAVALSKEEVMNRRMIFGLKSGLDRRVFLDTYGVDVIQAPFSQTLQELTEAGGVDITESTVKLSKVGALFADWIQMAFYSDYYKEKERKRMSFTVATAPQ